MTWQQVRRNPSLPSFLAYLLLASPPLTPQQLLQPWSTCCTCSKRGEHEQIEPSLKRHGGNINVQSYQEEKNTFKELWF